MDQFPEILKRYNKSEVFNYLTNLSTKLSNKEELESIPESDYLIYLSQLNQLVDKANIPYDTKKKKDADATAAADESKQQISYNVYRLVSKNFVLVLHKLPSKVYDLANLLLNFLVLRDNGELSPITQISIIILIDLYENFPNSLGSLINFSITQIYKILKKYPNINSNLIFLLNSITKNATKMDIDEKTQAKLMKVVTKGITSETISYNMDQECTSSVLMKKNYVLCYKNLLLLAVSTNYEMLLAASTSSSSAGAKMKPEAIMNLQHQFQMNLITTNEKNISYGLSNYSKEVRIAMVELLANFLINLVPTGKFNAIEYLVTLFPLPDYNQWDSTLSARFDPEGEPLIEVRREKNTILGRDSEAVINSTLELALFQASITETIIFYLQLEQFQNLEFLSTNLTFILDTILAKFVEINTMENHLMNEEWNKVVKYWSTVVEYIVQETGSASHEVLCQFIYGKFVPDAHNEDSAASSTSSADILTRTQSLNRQRKRESKIFLFKTKSSTKKKNISTQEVFPYKNPYQAYFLLFIIDMLLPYGVNFESLKKEEKPVSKDDDGELELPKTSNESNSSFIRDILLNLIVNNNCYIRSYALQSLLVYAKNELAEINQLILYTFRLVDQEHKHSDKEGSKGDENISPISSVRLFSYSLALLSLIKQTDPALLQNLTIVKVLSFCTQTLKHNSQSGVKNASCWIILSSLVTLYNFSEYVKLNSSQFLVFWKSLLTSQFISTSISSSTPEGQAHEIIVNLQLRNFSLVCLLNYLNSVELTPESLKQIQFLLTKSYNYLSYLESNIDVVGGITSLNSTSFNESDYNPNILNNLSYTNFAFNNKLANDRVLISLIFYSKKILFQSFTKLATLLKNDINSNMVIFLIKVFSDAKLFSRLQSPETEKPKTKSKSLNKVADLDDNLVLSDGYNYSFGVTSKFQTGSVNIDELLIKFPFDFGREETQWLRNTFVTERTPLPKSSIEQEYQPEVGSWFDYFEKIAFLSTDNSINYEPGILLTQNYSAHTKFLTNLTTSLVDLSIELFQLVFPYLSTKIQFSLLEQIRNSLTAKPIDPLRLKAIQINVATALHGVVSNITKKKIALDESITLVIVDIIKKMPLESDELIKINASTFGLVTQLLDKDGTMGQITGLINDIVTDLNPYKRGFSLLSLSSIYWNSKVGFSDIYSISLQLLNDPNPVVYHFTIVSTIQLFEANLDNILLIPTVLNKIYSSYLNDYFGYDTTNKILVNLKTKFTSISELTKLLKLFVSSLGPTLRDWEPQEKVKLKDLIISLSYGVGLTTLDDYVEVYKQLLLLFQELIIFDPNLIEGEVGFFRDLLNLIISKNLKISLASVSPTSLNIDTIFPFNSSDDLYSGAYECYYELLKIFGVEILTPETINLLWVSMNIKPCHQLKQFIYLWLETSLDKNWFGILNSLFKLSSKKLMGPFIETNYQQKLLPLLQRQKKKSVNNVDFRDEEIENIVGDNLSDLDKNEPISWEFKLFIYELLNHLLELAVRNPKLIDRLKLKIADIVKLSFLGSTSSITEIKIKGIELLNRALGLFGELADPLYPGVSILEQQQAQIISALIPCFAPGNDYKVIVDAINVSSKFINLPRIKFYSKQRILKTLIYLLEEISSNKFVRFGFLENMSEFGRKSIQLSILNCWAVLKIDAYEDPENVEPEFAETLAKYSTLLTSLWILVLREFSTLKYSESSSRELEIYGNYWINLVSVLSSELETNSEFINKQLSGDAQNFFFILFSQCVESLIKNRNVPEILMSVKRLVKSPDLVTLLFNNEIFGEIVDLFDRLILIDDDTEIQCSLVEIISILFHTYVKAHKDDLESGFDKLFELIRIAMLPLFRILPFLRSDFDPNNESNQLVLKHVDSAANLLVLKKAFENLTEMTIALPDVVRADLYSCLLYIFAKIYESKNRLLISLIVPLLKLIVVESHKVAPDLVTTFYNNIRENFEIDVQNNYSVITTLILVTNGEVKLSDESSKNLSHSLLQLLENNETAATGIQCIKSLLQFSHKLHENLAVIKYLISSLIKHLSGGSDDYSIEPRIAIEILMLFTRLVVDDEQKQIALYSIIVPVLVRQEEVEKSYLHEKLIFLVQQNANSFKQVVNSYLDDEQKKLTEEIVKLNAGTNGRTINQSQDSFEQAPEIKLKTFGA
ncbi:AP-1 accessory protein LAA1 [Candida viswanathii]|uniref:AP-1 accessory protein LAA1 n=1 Tax=Candida viswanathii TaxID=5486 RepID=A0A367YK09_9ASCO|nr:AP-1 accessory protein LAA1 [Candida viswanathii]